MGAVALGSAPRGKRQGIARIARQYLVERFGTPQFRTESRTGAIRSDTSFSTDCRAVPRFAPRREPGYALSALARAEWSEQLFLHTPADSDGNCRCCLAPGVFQCCKLSALAWSFQAERNQHSAFLGCRTLPLDTSASGREHPTFARRRCYRPAR